MKEQSLYCAVILRHRWSAYLDETEKQLIAANRRQFTPHGVVRIAKAYAVRRGLNLHEEGAAVELAKLLSTELRTFKGSLSERASRLGEIAEAIGRFTYGSQISAVSKFAWFLWPEGWTMYDSRARKALRVGDHLSFYNKLMELGFEDTTSKIDHVLKHHGMAGLAAGRVIDTYLLVRSADDRASDAELAEAHLLGLDGSVRDTLRTAAEQIRDLIRHDSVISESL